MVFVASKLKLPIAVHVEQFILEAAHARWYKEGSFSWLKSPKEQQDVHDDTGSTVSSEGEDEYDDNSSSSSIEHEEPDFSIVLLQNALDNLMDLSLAKSSEDCIYSFPTQELTEPPGSGESRALMTQDMGPNHEPSSAHERPASFELPKVIPVFRNRLMGS